MVEDWAASREATRGPSEKVEEARACAAAMREWQKPGSRDSSDDAAVVKAILINSQRKATSVDEVVGQIVDYIKTR